jgi:hypothetical protein
MNELFIISIVCLIVGIACLGLTFYLYKRWVRQRGPRAKRGKVSVVKVKPETVDLSSPDKALRSYWEYLDYLRSAKREPRINLHTECDRSFDEYLNQITPIEEPFLDTFFAGKALQTRLENMRNPNLSLWGQVAKDPTEEMQIKYERKLKEIKFETDTKAKAICRVCNVTPLDNLKQPLTKEGKDQRERGIDFIYTMEKFEKEWKITGRKAMCPLCFGAGRVKGEICLRCNGWGWLVLDVPKELSGAEQGNYWYYSANLDDN